MLVQDSLRQLVSIETDTTEGIIINMAGFIDYVYLLVIAAETVRICNFVSVSFEDNTVHPGFGKTAFPVKIDTCYKITFPSEDIGSSLFAHIPINNRVASDDDEISY